MVPAVVSRSFGIGVKLIDDELKKKKKRQTSSEWSKYISSNKAIDINEINQKSFQ